MEICRDGVSGAAKRGIREDRGRAEKILVLLKVKGPRELSEELSRGVKKRGRWS